MVDRGLFFQPGSDPIVKPLGYVGNTVHMMQKLLFSENKQVDGSTYYLADYPESSIRQWADLIRKNLGKGKTLDLPISLMQLVAKAGDLLKTLGWSDPPLTSFRLKNMLTGAHYPIEKTKEVVGGLPFNLEEGVRQTLIWMKQQQLIKNNTVII